MASSGSDEETPNQFALDESMLMSMVPEEQAFLMQVRRF